MSAEELYELRKAAFQQWTEAGLHTYVAKTPIERFRQTLQDKTVFVAQDEATGELLAMRTLTLYAKKGKAVENNLSVSPKVKRQGIATRLFEAEKEWLLKAGYRYVTCTTGTTATWSVRWHLKNGYYIVGYSRNENRNYALYIFRKQIAFDVRHHPTDLLWMRPVAPLTAKVQYVMYYLATNVCKTREGRLNWLGRWAKRVAQSLQRY